MTALAYYNEIDNHAASWLRHLIEAGHIAPGVVDTRSIEDVQPSDLTGFTQCHFFAGIGVWSYAIRRAGWPDDRPVWTGSCPCQPFSAAGKGAGVDDERHLWPHFHCLIRQCRPAKVFGEQVASSDGLAWLDLVSADLEGEGYAFGAADLCAAGVGAPHIRQRLYWVADAGHESTRRTTRPSEAQGGWALCELAGCGDALRLAYSSTRLEGRHEGAMGHERQAAERGGCAGGVADGALCGRGEERPHAGWLAVGDRAQGVSPRLGAGGSDLRPGPTNGRWRDADWLLCRDGKWRAVEPGTFPLAHGAPARVGRLRGYGNAIVAQCAEAFVRAAA